MVQKKLQGKYLIDPGASVSLFQFESLDDDKEGWPNIEIHFERTLTSRWCLTLERSNKKVQKDIYLCIMLSTMSYQGRCLLQKRLSFSSQYIILLYEGLRASQNGLAILYQKCVCLNYSMTGVLKKLELRCCNLQYLSSQVSYLDTYNRTFEPVHPTNCPIKFLRWYAQFHSENR